MDDMRQRISLSRRRYNIVKLRLCNMAAECYRQSTCPRNSDESRGRCCLCGKLCPTDFWKLSTDAFGRSFGRASRPMLRSELQPGFTADAFGRSFGRASQPMLSVRASVGLHDRCVRSELRPGFTADAFGRSFSRASQPMRSVGASAGLHA